MEQKSNHYANKVIEDLLKARKIKYTTFAKKVGINLNTFRGYINSASTIPIGNLQKIAKALNVSTSYLLGEKECLQEKEKLQQEIHSMLAILSEMKKIIEDK